jgi:hypothetical protein
MLSVRHTRAGRDALLPGQNAESEEAQGHANRSSLALCL